MTSFLPSEVHSITPFCVSPNSDVLVLSLALPPTIWETADKHTPFIPHVRVHLKAPVGTVAHNVLTHGVDGVAVFHLQLIVKVPEVEFVANNKIHIFLNKNAAGQHVVGLEHSIWPLSELVFSGATLPGLGGGVCLVTTSISCYKATE